MCFCRDFNPAWLERKKAESAVLSAVREFDLASSDQVAAAYEAVVGQLCAQFFPGFTQLGIGYPIVERVFFWASIKSPCLELPTNTGGLCWACHFVPSLLCMDYAQGWFQCFVKSVLQTPEMVHFYTNMWQVKFINSTSKDCWHNIRTLVCSWVILPNCVRSVSVPKEYRW